MHSGFLLLLRSRLADNPLALAQLSHSEKNVIGSVDKRKQIPLESLSFLNLPMKVPFQYLYFREDP